MKREKPWAVSFNLKQASVLKQILHSFKNIIFQENDGKFRAELFDIFLRTLFGTMFNKFQDRRYLYE